MTAAIVAVVVALGWMQLRRHRAAVASTAEREAGQLAAAAALDLVAVCVAAGLTPGAAISRVVEARTPPEWLREIDVALRAGSQLADALDDPDLIEDDWLRRSLGPIAAASRSGGSVTDALDRTVERLRRDVRRAREERARRLPVALLLPLTFCVLPAVVLVVVAPMVTQMLIGAS